MASKQAAPASRYRIAWRSAPRSNSAASCAAQSGGAGVAAARNGNGGVAKQRKRRKAKNNQQSAKVIAGGMKIIGGVKWRKRHRCVARAGARMAMAALWRRKIINVSSMAWRINGINISGVLQSASKYGNG
jgi:hypothetical protein